MKNLPFNHDKGELVYYQKIKRGLETALEEGVIPKEYFPYFKRAPIKIRGLLERDEPYILG